MKVLAVTNMWPTPRHPRTGTFVRAQVQGLERIGVEVRPLLFDRVSGGMAAYLRTSAAVRRECRRFRPDVVHVIYGGVMAELASRSLRGAPLVQAFCGTDLLGEQTGSALQRLRGMVGVVCSRRAARRAQQIVVKSRNLARALPADIDPSRVHIIANGVDLDLFSPADSADCRGQLSWRDGVLHVLFCTPSRSDANKRLPLAERAVATLAQRGTPAELHIMTDTPHDEVPRWLNAADVVLITSAHEGSPNIAKEALACNRPVVSVDVGDVRERIEGIQGCYIADADPEHLADKLAAVARGPRLVAARDTMAQLSIEAVARKLVQVYEEAIGREVHV